MNEGENLNYQQQMQVKRWLNKPFLTYTFLAIQIFIFVLGALMPSLNIEGRGGMARPYIFYLHQYYRFFTPIFVHFGLEHILFNSIVLYFMGSQIEAIYGHVRYFLIYMFSGALGNAFSMAFHSENVLSAGASSSILGLFGAFLIFGYHFRNNPAIQGQMRTFLLFVVMTFLSSVISPSVDLWGHLGGLIGGAALGSLMAIPNAKERYSIHERILGVIIFVFLFVVCVFVGLKKSGLPL